MGKQIDVVTKTVLKTDSLKGIEGSTPSFPALNGNVAKMAYATILRIVTERCVGSTPTIPIEPMQGSLPTRGAWIETTVGDKRQVGTS